MSAIHKWRDRSPILSRRQVSPAHQEVCAYSSAAHYQGTGDLHGHRRPQFNLPGFDYDCGRRQFNAFILTPRGFNLNLSWCCGRLDDHLREAIEQRTSRFFVAFMRIGIAVAYADEPALAGHAEMKVMVSGGHRPA